MAVINYTAAQIAPVFPDKAVIRSYIASETITKGQPVYFVAATGKVGIADANGAGKQQFRGVALNGAGAGCAVDVLQDGEMYGFDLAGHNADSFAYLSDAAAYDDGVGTMTVPVGRVVMLSDGSLTRVLRIFVQWEAQWA